uniref:hypothetical protein n=1 Tax=Dokdonella sp. TaxID=2291710 RepID=UPI002BD3EB42
MKTTDEAHALANGQGRNFHIVQRRDLNDGWGEITQRRFHGVSLSDNPPTKQLVDRVAEGCSNGI